MRVLLSASVSILLCACGGDSSSPFTATSIEITTPAAGTATAGLPIPTSPAFVVKDQNGSIMAGVPVSVTISAGGGSIVGAPSVSGSQATSVGTWTLGAAVGTNSISISVGGISPSIVSVSSSPGDPATIVRSTTTTLAGTVGQVVATPLSVTLKDAFGNPLAGVALNLSVTGGGSVAPTITTDVAGNATVPTWTLGTVKGANGLTVSVGAATATFTASAAPGPSRGWRCSVVIIRPRSRERLCQ